MSGFPIPRLKDLLQLLGWIGGLILAGCLCWALTGSLRAERLRESVNILWTRAGDTRRLEAAIPAASLEPRAARLGSWFTLNNGKRALVFTFFADGTFFPCAAIINTGAREKVEELIALTANGIGPLDRVSPGLKQLYIRRIEGKNNE